MLTFTKQPPMAPSGPQPSDELALALRFLGADPAVEPQGVERTAGVVNDLRGSDPSRWRTGVPQFRDVVYADLWPNIDLRLREQVRRAEVRVPRASGRVADRHRARLRRRARAWPSAADGGLQISTALGVLGDSAPVSYQDIARRSERRWRAATCCGEGDGRPILLRRRRATGRTTNW